MATRAIHDERTQNEQRADLSMDHIKMAMDGLQNSQLGADRARTISFEQFLLLLRKYPSRFIRNVHQVFYDMIHTYVPTGLDEYPDDPESINFFAYDCHKLFVENTDQPFFADRIFSNRLMGMVEGFRGGAQQNKIFIFDGPPGCGKSIFLNNLLKKFEEYANSPEGTRFETVWRLDPALLGDGLDIDTVPVMEKLAALLQDQEGGKEALTAMTGNHSPRMHKGFLEVPCPSHDNPILMVPKDHRPAFLDQLFENDEFKWNLSYGKEYDWVFRDQPCTICTSLFKALLHKLGDVSEVYKMLHARPYHFNRRQGEGITVFNPGDRTSRQTILTNPQLQKRLSSMLQDSNKVRYTYSRYAKTNNGIYALMDIKGANKERLVELHNIISDGVHKVDDIEESVYSLFLGVMNPEDNKNIRGMQSLSDRIEFINISYVLDSTTEVEIYKNIFGHHINDHFLPRVLENFARVIIASRLNKKSTALEGWVEDPEKYKLYCDENLHLLKMAIYTGKIPTWLDEDDRKAFTSKMRRKIIAEAENEGMQGFSGRDALDIFQELYSTYARDDAMITMDTLCSFFRKSRPDLAKQLPEGFMTSLRRMYNYQILQEVKESLYYYNEEQIGRDIMNYIFAVNYEAGTTAVGKFTGDKLEITDSFLVNIENNLLGHNVREGRRKEFREETQREYTSKTLTQDIIVNEMEIQDTDLFAELHERYVFGLKEKVLEPFLANENFRMALKEFGREKFKTYDQKIREDISYLIANLCDRFGYSEAGAREVCIYVVDNNIAEEFEE